MTTKANEPAQYRVTGGWWQTVQVAVPEGKAAQNSMFHGGDILPTWVTEAHLQHLLSVGAIEKVEATA